MKIKCPHCSERSSLIDIEEFGGECPYCGMVLIEEDELFKTNRPSKSSREQGYDLEENYSEN